MLIHRYDLTGQSVGSIPVSPALRGGYRLVGVVVKASASGAEDLGFESRSRRREFPGSSHTGDLRIDTPVATQPGAWCHRVNAGTGWSGVSIL